MGDIVSISLKICSLKAAFQMKKRFRGKHFRRQCFQIPGKFMQSIKLQKQIRFETRCFWNLFVSEYLFQLRNFWKRCRGKHFRWKCFEIPWKCIQLQIRKHSKQKHKFIWFSHASLISHIHCFDSTFPEFENIAAGNVFLGNVFSSETQPKHQPDFVIFHQIIFFSRLDQDTEVDATQENRTF